MRFVEICTDLGGSRLGLEASGFVCSSSVTWQQVLDGGLTARHRLPRSCDLVTLQTPASESLGGCWSAEGHWFGVQGLAKTLDQILVRVDPNAVLITGRRNVLRDRFGASFAELIASLTKRGYEAGWIRINLAWLGVPQDSYRVIVVARRRVGSARSAEGELGRRILQSLSDAVSGIARIGPPQSIENVLQERKPRVGLQAPETTDPFGSVGIACGGYFQAGTLKSQHYGPAQPSLAEVLGLDRSVIRHQPVSVRFVSRGGARGLQVKDRGLAHSVGPGISAWPLLGVRAGEPERRLIPTDTYNWCSPAFGYTVFRLTPARALMLFGTGAEQLTPVLMNSSLSIAEQYRAMSVTVPPVLIARLTETLTDRR